MRGRCEVNWDLAYERKNVMGKLNEKEMQLLNTYDYSNCPDHCKDCEEKCLSTSRRECVDNLKRSLKTNG